MKLRAARWVSSSIRLTPEPFFMHPRRMPKRLSFHVFVSLCLGSFHLVFSSGCVTVDSKTLHFSSIVVDTHADTTQLLLNPDFDINVRHSQYHVDIPRIKEGGLDAMFFSIWTPGTNTGESAVREAHRQINAVLAIPKKYPESVVLAKTAQDIVNANAQGKIAALMGVEGGHMINGDLSILREFAQQGVRYMTLTHSVDTDFADSSTGKQQHNGLTDFGRSVVKEMNRLGIMVDVSHVSDKTLYDVLRISKAPVIASHSSCRALSDHPRNMSDELLGAVAKNGGVVQITFVLPFLSQPFKEALENNRKLEEQLKAAAKKDCGADESCFMDSFSRQIYEAQSNGLLPSVDWTLIVDHIDHAVKIAGIDHVGLGSDFDGAFLPQGLNSVSQLPLITAELMKRGYKAEDIKKILGENTLRVMRQVEQVSKSTNSIH